MKKLLVAVLLLLASACASLTGAEVRSSVHSISNDRGTCSAVVLEPGLVLTADHCAAVDGLKFEGQGVAGTVLRRGNDSLDIALMSFPSAACPCARIADREADVDEQVYVVGYPRGFAQVVTYGTSQGVHDHAGMPFGRRLITTAPVAPGNSGGGVFVFRDGEYQLVGVLVELVDHLSFAVPLADIRPFLAQ